MGGKKKTDSGSLWLISNRPQSSPPPCKACWDILLASRTTEQRVRYRRNKEQHSKVEESLRSFVFFFFKSARVHVALLMKGPVMDPVKEGAFSRRPDNSAFKQQRLPAWTPMLTARSVLPFLYFTGLICLLLGIWLILTVQTIQEIKVSAFPCFKVYC